FREDVYGAQLARPVRCFGLGMSREDDHRQIGKSASNARENRKAIKSGHDEIEENAIDRRGFHDIEGFDPVEGYQYVVSFDTQHFREHLSDRRIVFDDQYAHGRLRARSIRAEGSARQGLTFGTAHAS